jgi:hypothetical protein
LTRGALVCVIFRSKGGLPAAAGGSGVTTVLDLVVTAAVAIAGMAVALAGMAVIGTGDLVSIFRGMKRDEGGGPAAVPPLLRLVDAP